MAAELARSPGTSSLGGRSVVRVVLVLLLLGLGAVLLFGQPLVVAAIRRGELPLETLFAAPGLFLLLVVVLGVNAGRSVLRRGALGGKGFVQIVAVLAFFGLVANNTWREYQARSMAESDEGTTLRALARSRDARVRALVMEVAGYRAGDDAPLASVLLQGLNDADPAVVESARRAATRRFVPEGEPLSEDRARALLRDKAGGSTQAP